MSRSLCILHRLESQCSARFSSPLSRSVFCDSRRHFNSSSRGLFSIPELQSPNDFIKLAHQAIEDCDSLREQVSSPRNDRHCLFLLDAISRQVCNVIDAAELARSVHASEAWRDAASRAFAVLSDYIAQLNADPSLYNALQAVDPSQLNEEEVRFAVLLKAEFERDGIHLPDQAREEVRQIQNRLIQLEEVFHRNIVTHKQDFFVEAALVDAVISRDVLQSFGLGNPSAKDASQLQLCKSSTQILQTLVKYSSSPELRKQVYMASNTAVPENLPVLSALIQTRHELATAMGFPSYADRFLRDKMAGNQQHVLNFLGQVQKQIQPTWKKEMELLQRVKQHVEPDAATSALEPWDISFYSNLVQSQKGFDIQSVSQYLSLPNCINGMQTLVKDLFGIQMKEEELTEAESWDINQDARGVSNGTETRVRRFSFSDPDGNPLGIMYLDLYPRQGKYNHAAHFTVRCGCRTGFVEDVVTDDDKDKDNFQLPIIALVCNLSGGERLSHSEVETLFHEFGHALHSLLSRTEFQHMSGTRGAIDFVETPSHLMEYFCWDADFLSNTLAKDLLGNPIPAEMITQLQESRYEFSAIERKNQILYALFDQTLFGGNDMLLASVTKDPEHATTRVFAGLHEQLGIPYAAGTHWHSRFGHLITYGAGYYGYQYAQVFAGDLWRQLFENQSDRRTAGDRLWHGLLQHGGAKDPNVMLADLLGQKIYSKLD